MSSGWIVALELIAVLGVVLGFGAWELLSLRRDRQRERRQRAERGIRNGSSD